MSDRPIFEPFKIKMVEPLAILTRAERAEILAEAGYNLFQVAAEHITFDFLTDSGTTAMSAAQWAAMMIADEAYAGSRSFHKFRHVVEDLTGFAHIIPTHQGRAAEKLLSQAVVKPGHIIPNNNHFDTTRANFEYAGAQALDLVIEEGKMPSLDHPFKGNMNIEALDELCRNHKGQIPFGMMTLTNNTGGGQPASLENIRQVSDTLHRHGIPFLIDACRFAENAYFIKCREAGQESRSVREIAQEIFSLADGCTMSAKKDGLVNIGGFIALRSDEWVQNLRNLLILTEGFPTYGGLAARDLEALAVGLQEVLDERYLEYRTAIPRYLAARFNEMGIPTVQPAGGHAVYIDARALLPQIPPHEFPGQALVCELYLAEGIRSCEIGSAMFGTFDSEGQFHAPAMDLVRLAIPRRVYTQSQFDYFIEGIRQIVPSFAQLRGLKLTYDPPFLRHFTAKFAPLT